MQIIISNLRGIKSVPKSCQRQNDHYGLSLQSLGTLPRLISWPTANVIRTQAHRVLNEEVWMVEDLGVCLINSFRTRNRKPI